MIQITDKKNCCGCWACEQICPMHCITMEMDNEGFSYPIVDTKTCTNCGLCVKVCPVIHQQKSIASKPKSYACVNNDKIIREKSSSGGMFSLFAKSVIDNGGVVFGARFENDWSVTHDYTESIEGLEVFRGSKYVESKIGDNYIKAKRFLEQGRKVLFSGTPCQIAGLNSFLRKRYENLILIDIVCHSIPSSKIWKMYLDELRESNITNTEFKNLDLTNNINQINFSNISFRNKTNGWKEYSILVERKITEDISLKKFNLLETKTQNLYMKGFLQNLYTRPSCTKCPARKYTSGSDIQIADFWGVEKYYPQIPILNDDKGVSLALIITKKGEAFFETISSKIYSLQIKYEEVEEHGLHAPLMHSALPHKNREKFFLNVSRMSLTKNIKKCLIFEEKKKIMIINVKNTLRFLIGDFFYNYLKKKINVK